MNLIKVHNGTTKDGENLCKTCANGLYRRGSAEGDEYIRCLLMGGGITITTKTVECTGYYRRGQTTLQDLYKTAWILETGKNDRNIGFIPYRDWRARHREDEVFPGSGAPAGVGY